MGHTPFETLDFLEQIVNHSAERAAYKADPEAYLLSKGCPPASLDLLVRLSQMVATGVEEVSTVMILMSTGTPRAQALSADLQDTHPPIPIPELSITLEGVDIYVAEPGEKTFPVVQEESQLTYSDDYSAAQFRIVLQIDKDNPHRRLILSAGDLAFKHAARFPKKLKLTFSGVLPGAFGSGSARVLAGVYDISNHWLLVQALAQ
ncbi:MAG TPA: hypothetical protein VFS21_25245 [Roseiflexaceae bacterium]|nr:hypothetical protein [Roseiflexaceae bacterium]